MVFHSKRYSCIRIVGIAGLQLASPPHRQACAQAGWHLMKPQLFRCVRIKWQRRPPVFLIVLPQFIQRPPSARTISPRVTSGPHLDRYRSLRTDTQPQPKISTMKIQFLVLAVALGVKVNAILINGCMSNAGGILYLLEVLGELVLKHLSTDTCHRWAPCCASNSLVCNNNKCESCVAVGGECLDQTQRATRRHLY